MNVNDYLRDNKGNIAKIIEVERENNWLTVRYDNVFNHITGITYNLIHFKNEEEILEYNHIKSSPNIIDLIEEHDLVVIEYYSLRYKERVTRLFEVDYKDKEFMTIKNAYCDFTLRNNEFRDRDKNLKPIIKSIVTHEQFESMEYKVGE